MRLKLLFLAVLYFPGTVLHEFSHFAMAKLLMVPTGSMSLTPKFNAEGLELGHVQIAKTDFVRRFLIGIAPLLSGVSVLLLLLYLCLNTSLSWWQMILVLYVLLTVLNTMNLSRSDLHGAWKIVLILVLALLFAVALHWIYGY